MKQLTLERTIDDFTVQEYYDVNYSDEKGIRRFHKEETKDPNAEVTDWKDGKRTCTFRMALNVPQMLKNIIGADSITVVEHQAIKWEGSEKFTVTSAPALNFPGANKFTTQGAITVSATPGGSVQVTCVMSCNAAMPWPMQGTVESVMATEATSSVGNFLKFCERLCEEARETRKAEPVSEAEMEVLEEYEGDLFYDAAEHEQDLCTSEDSRGSRGAVAVAARAGSGVAVGARANGHRAVVPQVPATPENLLIAVQHLQASSAETAHALQALTEQIKAMNENIAAIREVVAPGQGSGGGLRLAGSTSVWWSGPSPWLLLALAAGSAAAVVYVRTSQRNAVGSA